MAGVVMVFAGVALIAILVWTFGSWIGRVAGIVLVIDGLGGLVIRGGSLDNPRFAWEALAGVALWLVGHWLFAAKHGMWRSRLGRGVWGLPVFRWVSPLRG